MPGVIVRVAMGLECCEEVPFAAESAESVIVAVETANCRFQLLHAPREAIVTGDRCLEVTLKGLPQNHQPRTADAGPCSRRKK